MLTDEQIDIIGETLVPIFQRLEKATILDIARRVQKMQLWTETAEYQARALRELGFSPARIQRDVLKQLGADKAYQRALAQNTLEYKRTLAQSIKAAQAEGNRTAADVLEKSAELAFQQDMRLWHSAGKDLTKSNALSQIVQSITKQTQATCQNLTGTAAFKVGGRYTRASSAFQRTVDDALLRTVTGTTSHTEAARKAVSELAKQGMATVTYTDSGKTIVRQADSAVRTAMQTSAEQLAAQVTMANCEKMGVKHVEVSAHWGARTDGSGGHADHQAWQGKVYQIDGASPDYPNLEDKTGYPSDPLGLCGYNCRHSMSPFWVGISTPNPWEPEPKPVSIEGKDYTVYQASQKMRAMEREIRALKRQAYAGEEIPQSLMEAKKDAYSAFCKAANQRAKWERTMVDGEGAADWKRIFGK